MSDFKRYIYGFSIQELLHNNCIPQLSRFGYLDLSHKYINSLEGLQNIPDIQNVQILNLNNNELTSLSPELFAGLGRLEGLYLDDNQLNPETITQIRKVESAWVRIT